MHRLVAWLKTILPRNEEREETTVAPGAAIALPPERRRPALLADAKSIPSKPTADEYDADSELGHHLADTGPGKNVLLRRQLHRQHAGTSDELKIVGDEMHTRPGDTGFDPYNTGQFDRSANWSRAARK